MKKSTNRMIYLIATVLLTVIMLGSAGMYVFNNEMVRDTFAVLGFPLYIIYPLAAAKILGLIAIWTNKSSTLKEWAYAGFFFNLILAISAHLSISDGDYPGALIALALLLISYIYSKKK